MPYSDEVHGSVYLLSTFIVRMEMYSEKTIAEIRHELDGFLDYETRAAADRFIEALLSIYNGD